MYKRSASLLMTIGLLGSVVAGVVGVVAASPASAGNIETVPYDHGCWGYAGTTNAPEGDPSIPRLRVGEYNIDEGRPIEKLNAAADIMSPYQADILLLNEIECRGMRIYPEDDQAKYLANRLGFHYYAYESATALGLAGTKGVAVLSRFPISQVQMHKVLYNGWETTFGTLESWVQIGPVTHRVFSTRFHPLFPDDPNAEPENQAGHIQGIDMARAVPASIPVIFAGDFNATWSRWWSKAFHDQSGLADSFEQRPVPGELLNDRIDYVYYRGPYTVSRTELGGAGAPDYGPDHAFLFVELSRNQLTTVPSVVGKTSTDAVTTLRAAGLGVTQASVTNCDSPGTVDAQIPSGGSTVAPGSTVKMYVGAFNAKTCMQ